MTGKRWSEAETIQVGKDIFGLATEFQERLARRNITREYLEESLRAVAAAEGASGGQNVRIGAQKGTTLALGNALTEVGARVVAIRGAIQRSFPKRKDLHKAFGVGEPVAKGLTAALGAVEAVEEGAASYPTETAAAGILETDLSELRAMRDAVLAGDTTQEGAKSSKKSATAAKNGLLRDITVRVDRILSAAGLEFVSEPAIRARFEAPIPTKKKTKPSTPTT